MQKRKTDKELEEYYSNLKKTKLFVNELKKLNTIMPLLINEKITNLDAINNIEQYFYVDDKEFNKFIVENIEPGQSTLITVNESDYRIHNYGKINLHISFRIFFIDFDTAPKTMKDNYYLFRNNKDITNDKGYMFAFSNDLVIDTYMSAIIKILFNRHDSINNCINNYATFINNDIYYQLKENYNMTLTEYIENNLEINEDKIKQIISMVLKILYVLKYDEYGFNHGNLTTDNIFVNMNDTDIKLKMGNFKQSSIFYNGIRFVNTKYIKDKNSIPINNGTYKITSKFSTFLPLPNSYDVYVFMLSLLMQPKILDFFNNNNKLFHNIYDDIIINGQQWNNLFTIITPNVKKISDAYNNINTFINKNNINNKYILDDLANLDYNTFDNIYSKILTKYYIKSTGSYFYSSPSSELYNLIKNYYDLKNQYNVFTLLEQIDLKENINTFFDNIIGTNPSKIIIDVNNLPYKQFSSRFFHISIKTTIGLSTFSIDVGTQEYHLCTSKCIYNQEQQNFICNTNKYTSFGKPNTWDYCIPTSNIYELIQYRIVSRILLYYDNNGNIDDTKLNNDPNWRTLINMIIDNKLLIPSFDCNNDFIFKGKLLNRNSASRSIQFINIDFNNIYDTLHLKHNNELIDEFIENITKNTDERYIIKPIILKLIHDIISKLNKQAFAKINAVSDSMDNNDYLINNEYKIYQITNKLLYFGYTPNISSLFIGADCDVNQATTYNNYKIRNNRSLKDYFNSEIGLNPNIRNLLSIPTLKSYKIFLLELLNNNVLLYDYIAKNINSLDDNQNFYNIMAILIQIAYTLECFYRIGLIHNDLHMENIFIETLKEPFDFFYIISSDDINEINKGQEIKKIIRIRTNYFVRIFDFDRSYTFPKSNNIPMKIEIIKRSTSPVGNDFSTKPELARKYDFSYLCRWIYVTFLKNRKYRFADIIHNIIGDTAANLDQKPLIYKQLEQYLNTELDATKNAKNPYTWLIELDYNENIIQTETDITKISIKDNSYIYTFPDINVDLLANKMDKNNSWKEKTIYQKINICGSIIKDVDNNLIITKINDLCKSQTTQNHIYWVRHAESCANFDQGTYIDKNIYPNRPFGFDNYVPKDVDKSNIQVNIGTKIKAPWKYEPNLSYIGMQQAIKLGTEFINKNKPYDIIICSALTRTIMTAILACRRTNNVIYVVPYINEIQNVFYMLNMDFQNTAVNSKILKKRIMFIKDWLQENWINNFDDIEVMDDLHNLRKILMEKDNIKFGFITTKILHYLTCKPNIKTNTDVEHKIETNIYTENPYVKCPNIIDLIIELIDYLNKNELQTLSFYEKYKNIVEDKFISFKRGATVNFKILEEYEKIYETKYQNGDKDAEEYNTHNSNIYKFYTEVLPKLLTLINSDFRKSNRILAISHGSLIRKIWETKDPVSYNEKEKSLLHMMNTEVFEETINYDKCTFKEMYHPKPIRTTYQNFEDLNVDVCRTQSIKGIINYNLYEPETYIGSVASNVKKLVSQHETPKNQRSFDVKFYDDARYKNIKIDDEVKGGNFYYKYQKYKSKYLLLKNNI